MTRSELRTRILSALNESATNPVFFSTGQIDSIIDEGAEILSEEANAVKRTAFVSLMEGTTYFYIRGIAQDMMAPYRLWLTHLDRRLTAVSLYDLDARNENWIETTGDPEYWFSVSWDLFGVYPSIAAGGGVIRVDYLAWPRSLMDDSDEPEFVLADQDGLVLYGVYEGLLKMLDVTRALQIFSMFVDKLNGSRVRHGIAKLDARAFQAPSAESQGFRHGITR